MAAPHVLRRVVGQRAHEQAAKPQAERHAAAEEVARVGASEHREHAHGGAHEGVHRAPEQQEAVRLPAGGMHGASASISRAGSGPAPQAGSSASRLSEVAELLAKTYEDHHRAFPGMSPDIKQ
jgi:hypothetical protein